MGKYNLLTSQSGKNKSFECCTAFMQVSSKASLDRSGSSLSSLTTSGSLSHVSRFVSHAVGSTTKTRTFLSHRTTYVPSSASSRTTGMYPAAASTSYPP